MVELFGTSSFFQCRWDMGTRGRCFKENGKKKLSLDDMITFHNWISFFSRLTSRTSYGLPLSTHLSFFCTSELICGFSPRLIRKKLQKIIIKRPTLRLLTWIQFGNPPPLLCLINRHSLAIFILVRSFRFLHRSYGLINLTIPTMYTSDAWAMIILVLYSITLCVVPRFVTNFWRTRR